MQIFLIEAKIFTIVGLGIFCALLDHFHWPGHIILYLLTYISMHIIILHKVLTIQHNRNMDYLCRHMPMKFFTLDLSHKVTVIYPAIKCLSKFSVNKKQHHCSLFYLIFRIFHTDPLPYVDIENKSNPARYNMVATILS